MQKLLGNIDKGNLLRSFIFILILSTVYSLMCNISIIKLSYPAKYLIPLLLLSIMRDYIIWFIAYLNRWVFAVFTIFTFIAGGGLRYVNEYLKMSLNIGTFEVIFSTNIQEAAGIMNSSLITHFVIYGIIGIIFVFFRFKFPPKFDNKKKAAYSMTALFIIAVIFLIIGKIPEDSLKKIKFGYYEKAIEKSGRGFDIMPEKIYENFYQLFINRMAVKHMLSQRKDFNSIQGVKYNGDNDKVVIVLLTDALRPDHMSLYGYERDTTPYMKQHGFIPFKDMYACDTSTTRSVPCLLTKMKRNSHIFDYVKQPSLFNMYNAAGFYTAWLSSQNYISTSDQGQLIMSKDADYNFYEKNISVAKDRELLKYVDEILKSNNQNKFFIIQLYGSHWDYNIRYDKKDAKYTPVCSEFALSCPQTNLVNSYDNSILETDRLVNTLIDMVKDKDASIYFTSDHAEFLGEGGIRLHAPNMKNYKEVAVVPFAVWFSEKAKKHINMQNVINNKDKISTHDAVFHSVAGCGGLSSDLIDNTSNICSDDFKAVPDEFENYVSKPVE